MANNFQPIIGATQTVSSSASNATIQIGGEGDYTLTNPSTVEAFFRTGTGTVIASTTSDMPILPGAIMTLRKPPEHTVLAVISASGTTTVRYTPGWGN